MDTWGNGSKTLIMIIHQTSYGVLLTGRGTNCSISLLNEIRYIHINQTDEKWMKAMLWGRLFIFMAWFGSTCVLEIETRFWPWSLLGWLRPYPRSIGAHCTLLWDLKWWKCHGLYRTHVWTYLNIYDSIFPETFRNYTKDHWRCSGSSRTTTYT